VPWPPTRRWSSATRSRRRWTSRWQAAVLSLLADLRRDLGLSLLFITHDLGVVATVADEVLVLESGTVCERGPTAEVLAAPQHPYTQRLLDAAPSVVEAVDRWNAA